MESPIARVPPPWTLHGDVYIFPFWTPSTVASSLPSQTHAPLEASSSFAEPSSVSKPVGGLGMIQLIRYHDSPVGPYDEMVLIPGYFEVTREDENGKRRVERRARVTRIYVSQETTCYNGRLNWNIPKHLARFDWTTNTDSSLTISIFPSSPPSPTPLFRTTFHPSRIPHPSFPFSFNPTVFALMGFNTTLVQPPLPTGDSPELVGTQRWRGVVPGMSSSRCKVGWFDVRQEVGEGGEFWPGLGRWRVGVEMKGAEITFGHPEEWDAPGTTE